ncbi:UDP-glucose 6-dehydrogenase [Candidatus Saccharibacteria bacterium RAAC3_TM7_1]|nr:UDP-glucose 6-dehydrogenase [Candidatus Saccharibacteria bacterium RAAC3_TM7_1]
MNSPSTITVLGAGYVGLTTAALLAHAGYKVYAIEPNPKRLAVIKQGRSFFFEEGLDPIIKAAIDAGNFVATDSYQESVPESDVVFSSVGTPDNPDGSSNLSYVFSAAKEAASYMKNGAIYVQKSTVPVGTGRKVQALFQEMGKHFAYVSNPEFLREGTALYDTLYFDRVVAGGDDEQAVEAILAIYRQLEEHRDEIASQAGVTPNPRKGKYIATSLNSAELIKVTANAFLALKISFANSIAQLADKVDANVVEVMDAVGADERIGRAFLNAGRGYGGGCFPKDVSGLIASGLENGVDLEIMQSAQRTNSTMPGYIVEKLKKSLGELNGRKIAVLGLAFKAGTSDVRKSPGMAMVRLLHTAGATVLAHDPQAAEEACEAYDDALDIRPSISETIEAADAVIVATEWDEYRQLLPESFKAPMAGTTIVDAVNILDKNALTSAGLTYLGVGR